MLALSHADAIRMLEEQRGPEIHNFSFVDSSGTRTTAMQVGTRYTTVPARCVEYDGRSWKVTTFWGANFA